MHTYKQYLFSQRRQKTTFVSFIYMLLMCTTLYGHIFLDNYLIMNEIFPDNYLELFYVVKNIVFIAIFSLLLWTFINGREVALSTTFSEKAMPYYKKIRFAHLALLLMALAVLPSITYIVVNLDALSVAYQMTTIISIFTVCLNALVIISAIVVMIAAVCSVAFSVWSFSLCLHGITIFTIAISFIVTLKNLTTPESFLSHGLFCLGIYGFGLFAILYFTIHIKLLHKKEIIYRRINKKKYSVNDIY